MRPSIIVFTGIILSFLVADTFAQEIREVGYWDNGTVGSVAVSGDYAFIVVGGYGLMILDISDPENPDEIGDFELDVGVDIFISGEYAYIPEQIFVHVLDISNPEDPEHLERYNLGNNRYAANIYIVDNIAYVSGSNHFSLLDITDPTNLETIAVINRTYHRVFVVGEYAYLNSDDNEIAIYNISDPENPEMVSNTETDYYLRDILVFENSAYVLAINYGILVFDVSDPENPEETNSINVEGSPYRGSIYNNLLFVANFNGIVMIDISNHEVVGSYNTPGRAMDVFVCGIYVYVADVGGGLRILDVREFYDPDIHITDSIDFGIVEINQNLQQDFYIYNSGNNLEVDDISMEGNYFSVEFEDPFVIEPEDTAWVEITFSPEEEGVFEGTLTIISNDPDYGEVTIDLTGIGNELTIIHVPYDYETISAAIDTAMAGDTVQVAPGEYAENINFIGKNIVIRGNIDEPSETIIDGGENGSVITFQNGETSSARLSGFTICNGTGNEAEDLTFGGGIVCSGNANPTLDHLVIKDNTASYGGGIYCYGSEDQFIHKVAIFGNYATRAGGGLYISSGTGLILSNATISNNRCASGAGIWLGYDTEIEIINTIVWENEGVEIYVYGQEDVNTMTVAFTDIEGGIEGIAVNDNCEVHWNEGNINADPLFIDADNDNLHLTVNSPCIDAGNPESPLDPDSTRADMGAFYFHQRNIAVEPEELEFVGIQTGTVDSMVVVMRNEGMIPVLITSQIIEPEDTPFAVGLGRSNFELAPDSTHQTWITFSPEVEDEYHANFLIGLDSLEAEVIEIPITGTALGIELLDEILPVNFAIIGIHPNPFNSTTTITYGLPFPTYVSLTVYDATGREVRTLVDGNFQPGIHNAIMNSDGLASGIYIIRIHACGEVFTQKILLIR